VPLIAEIQARQIFDSRGNPTLEVDVFLADGSRGRARVPSGSSTGKHEAFELRDGDIRYHRGQGVLRANANVEQEIAPIVTGMDAGNQAAVDKAMLDLDATRDKRRLGANAILGVSLAVARAAAASAHLQLYRYLGGAAARQLPVPMINILSGRNHGSGNLDLQDFMLIPLRARRFSDAIECAVAVSQAMKDVLQARGVYHAGVAEEGGYAPELESNEAGFEVMVEAIERAGFAPGKDAAIAIDAAASHFWNGRRYVLSADGVELATEQLIARLEDWASRYPIVSIEDALDEEDWEGWRVLTERLGGRCQLVGDDLFTTSADLLQRGIEEDVANSILIKMNQAGTLTETLGAIGVAGQSGYNVIISARSGETEDDSIADLAVATSASQIKIGSVTCSERMVKYNRLLRIEQELGKSAVYRGAEVYSNAVVRMS
jgi:enolase 1/2/3